MRHPIFSIAAFSICTAGTFAATAQVPDRVQDMVQQARELAKNAHDSATGNPGNPISAQFQNPFSQQKPAGQAVGIQGSVPGSRPGVDISDSAIHINVGGRNISVPRTGPDAVDPAMGNTGRNQIAAGQSVHGGVTINGQPVGRGSSWGGVGTASPGDVTIDRNGSTISTATWRELAAGMEAFGKADFAAAAGHLEKSVAANPQDPMPHPFFSLALFANGNYDAAAEYAWSAAATSPIWDWNQLRSCYSDPAHYATQYEQLQIAARQANASPATQFLLAWHHLILGHRDAAQTELERVLQQLPNDPIATGLLNLARQPASFPPEPMK